jgi:glycosyltransferase involved in cell wall biosynthesis
MRIALVSNSLPPEPATGGAQDYVADLARDLQERHDVLVISGARGGLEGVECVSVPALRVLLPNEPMIAKAVWHLRDQWMPSVHRAVTDELRRFRPGVVHTHELQGISAAAFTAVARADLPHVHTAHDLNLLCVRVTMTRDGRYCGGRCTSCLVQRAVRGRLISRHLHCLIAPSDNYRRRHVEAGVVSPERAVTIRHGARPGVARLRAPSPGALSLGFIGNTAPHKGVLTLLETFRHAPSEWRLFVAGDGILRPHIERAAELDGRIEYCGYVRGDRKDAFYERLDLLVIPSEWEEAATLVAVEAAVRGLPAVVGDRGGLPETPEARVFSAGDPDALLDAIRWFLAAPDRLTHASRRLLAKREHYLWKTHIAEVERVLEAVARAVPETAA